MNPKLPRQEHATRTNSAPRSKVLIIDDCASDRRLMALALSRRLPHVDFRMVPDGDTAVAAIEEEEPDIVLLDLFMPRRSGLEVLSDITYASPCAPRIIVVTASTDETIRAEALAAGAQAVVEKPCLVSGYGPLIDLIGQYLGCSDDEPDPKSAAGDERG